MMIKEGKIKYHKWRISVRIGDIGLNKKEIRLIKKANLEMVEEILDRYHHIDITKPKECWIIWKSKLQLTSSVQERD